MSTWKTELMQVRYKVQAEIGIRVLRGTCMYDEGPDPRKGKYSQRY